MWIPRLPPLYLCPSPMSVFGRRIWACTGYSDFLTSLARFFALSLHPQIWSSLRLEFYSSDCFEFHFGCSSSCLTSEVLLLCSVVWRKTSRYLGTFQTYVILSMCASRYRAIASTTQQMSTLSSNRASRYSWSLLSTLKKPYRTNGILGYTPLLKGAAQLSKHYVFSYMWRRK